MAVAITKGRSAERLAAISSAESSVGGMEDVPSRSVGTEGECVGDVFGCDLCAANERKRFSESPPRWPSPWRFVFKGRSDSEAGEASVGGWRSQSKPFFTFVVVDGLVIRSRSRSSFNSLNASFRSSDVTPVKRDMTLRIERAVSEGNPARSVLAELASMLCSTIAMRRIRCSDLLGMALRDWMGVRT